MERRLVGILYADVVGYSRLMGADEAGTLSRLKAHRKEFIDPTIAAYQGRIVKIMGDGALVEFPSVVDAVDCAVDVQRGMVERNMDVSPHQQIVFRIGVNLGDVIIEGDDIYGDGVNVAARLEGLAEPGGICIPGRVLQQVEGKIDVGFAYLGEQSVKNIEKPVNAYKLLLDPADAGKTVGVPKAKAPRRRWPAVAACLVVLLAAAGALAVWLRPVETPVETALAQAATLPLPDEPSIAVLAFDNLSGNPEYEIFSDGVTEDIITELARNQDLFVIARNSSFAYKGKPADIQQIARELGVQYVLEGSVRRAGDQVRITAQLIDAATGRHLWAESYDRQMDNLFAVQEDVIRNIAGVLLSKVRAAETAAAFAKQTDDLRAYDLLKQGIELKHTFTKETSLKAREVLSKALEIDPNYAEAWVYLGYAWGVDYSLALTGPPQREWLDEAVRHIQKGIALKPSLAIAYQALNYTLLMRGEMEEALAAGLRSVELNPNDSENWIFLGRIQAYTGHPQEAIASAEKALRLNPFSPVYYQNLFGEILYAAEEYERGRNVARSCSARYPKFWKCRLILAAHLAALGDVEAARREMELVLAQRPKLSLQWANTLYTFRDAALKNRLLADFREAGLPEAPPSS